LRIAILSVAFAVVIPAFLKNGFPISDDRHYAPEFFGGEASGVCEAKIVQPELGDAPIALNVKMGRLDAVGTKKEEAIRPFSQNGRHRRRSSCSAATPAPYPITPSS
jgi:hypothetical protein